MIGAIVGDIVGSRFEWHNIKKKDFRLFHKRCCYTDDSAMTLAVCNAILRCRGDYTNLGAETVKSMQEIGRAYPDAGYGGSFYRWIFSDNPEPYNSWGNGAAMRISGCGFAGSSLDEVKIISRAVTETTHNHPEGIKGAEATAVAVYLARTGCGMSEIREHITSKYYPLDFTLDGIRRDYKFDVSCQGSVPQALEAFFESTSFEDAIRNAVSIGGDSDTIAAITGGIADAYYGVPDEIREMALTYLDDRLRSIIFEFEKIFPSKR